MVASDPVIGQQAPCHRLTNPLRGYRHAGRQGGDNPRYGWLGSSHILRVAAYCACTNHDRGCSRNEGWWSTDLGSKSKQRTSPTRSMLLASSPRIWQFRCGSSLARCRTAAADSTMSRARHSRRLRFCSPLSRMACCTASKGLLSTRRRYRPVCTITLKTMRDDALTKLRTGARVCLHSAVS